MLEYFVRNIQDLINIIITNSNIPPQMRIMMVAPAEIFLPPIIVCWLLHNIASIEGRTLVTTFVRPFISLLVDLFQNCFIRESFKVPFILIPLSCFNGLSLLDPSNSVMSQSREVNLPSEGLCPAWPGDGRCEERLTGTRGPSHLLHTPATTTSPSLYSLSGISGNITLINFRGCLIWSPF